MNSTVPVRVGDHDPEHSVSRINPRRSAELFAMRNCGPTLVELRALSDRFADAVQALQIGLTTEDFEAARQAVLTLHEVERQTSGLNLGLRHAITQGSQP